MQHKTEEGYFVAQALKKIYFTVFSPKKSWNIFSRSSSISVLRLLSCVQVLFLEDDFGNAFAGKYREHISAESGNA